MAPVKREVVDCLEEDHAPLHKRHKLQGVRMGGFVGPISHYNSLDEPCPLGLRLRKSPSLLELIQVKLFQGNMPNVGGHSRSNKESKGNVLSVDKMKASNFLASIIKIGTWEYKSRYEGDLVAKFYFAKHKLVWEVLDGGLKNKIEIQWSDIVSLKAKCMDDGPGTLNVVLARQPLFFRETNPQPRKHTLWQATSDFTGGQASINRKHFLECPHGLLGKHFEKLVQCDPRLNFLSQQEEITLESPYFDPELSILDDQAREDKFDLNNQGSFSIFSLQDAISPSGAQSSSSKNDQDTPDRHSGSYPCDTPSPCSARDGLTVVNMENGETELLKELDKWEHIMVPGLRPSMSMSDLVSHLENRISEQGAPNNPDLSKEEWRSLQFLDDVSRCLFSDSQTLLDLDEKSLMSRVNSLCCILQKDTAVSSSIDSASENCPDTPALQKSLNGSDNFGASSSKSTVEEENASLDDESFDTSGDNLAPRMPKTDSVGDLLLNLPRIASLPQFLFNTTEDFENRA